MDSSRKTWVQVLVMLSARCENEAPPSYAKRPLCEWAPLVMLSARCENEPLLVMLSARCENEPLL